MANADGVRGVSGRNCSAVCCVKNTPGPPKGDLLMANDDGRLKVKLRKVNGLYPLFLGDNGLSFIDKD